MSRRNVERFRQDLENVIFGVATRNTAAIKDEAARLLAMIPTEGKLFEWTRVMVCKGGSGNDSAAGKEWSKRNQWACVWVWCYQDRFWAADWRSREGFALTVPLSMFNSCWRTDLVDSFASLPYTCETPSTSCPPFFQSLTLLQSRRISASRPTSARILLSRLSLHSWASLDVAKWYIATRSPTRLKKQLAPAGRC